jgi:short-subunit dehydrogenase
MQLKNTRIVLTGGSGGIGSEIAKALAAKGARLVVAGRRAEPLAALQKEIFAAGRECHYVVADLATDAGRQSLVAQASELLGGIDMLVNAAGISSYALFAEESPAAIENLYQTNLIAPVLLTRLVLPQMIAQGHGHIVNVGSIFGSIGFACFVNYSSSKYALRGFSEALRRELEEDGIAVTYVAPRAVRTTINSPEVYRMAEAVKMKMDEPAVVAAQIVAAIEQERQDVYLGWPEKLFVRINGVLPRLVDGALRAQNRIMRGILKQS